MKKGSEGPAGAFRDYVFRHADGRIIDLPAKRWILANASRLTPRLGLSAFLSMLPAWLLREVEEEAARRSRQGAGGSRDPSSALILALEHLKLWAPESDTSRPEFLETLATCIERLRAACALESLRRRGVLRVHVAGEDRLDREASRSIELNPVVLAELQKSGLSPRGETDLLQRLSELSRLALETDWADHEALADDGMP